MIASIVNGMPTEIDVQKLVKHFGVPNVGRVIQYSEVAIVIGYPQNANRWKTVVAAWRRKLNRENNLILGTVPGEAFRVLDNHERVSYVTNKQEIGMRQIRKGAIVAARTERDGLSESEKSALDRSVMNGAALKLAFVTAPKQIEAPKAQAARNQARKGEARRGLAGLGKELGVAWIGGAGRGRAWHGKVKKLPPDLTAGEFNRSE